MAKTISSISDLENLVDTWAGSEPLGSHDSHDQNVKRVARVISAARPSDLTYGDDWSEYLENVESVHDIFESLD